MQKTLKIDETTHKRLESIGRIGETYDGLINRLLDNYTEMDDVILRVKIVGDKREIHLKNPMYYWTDQNYDVFLEKAFGMFSEWRDNVLKRIAKNPEWHRIVQRYKNQN
jgi:uncharacterized protein YdcH (DUF465 family)